MVCDRDGTVWLAGGNGYFGTAGGQKNYLDDVRERATPGFAECSSSMQIWRFKPSTSYWTWCAPCSQSAPAHSRVCDEPGCKAAQEAAIRRQSATAARATFLYALALLLCDAQAMSRSVAQGNANYMVARQYAGYAYDKIGHRFWFACHGCFVLTPFFLPAALEGCLADWCRARPWWWQTI